MASRRLLTAESRALLDAADYIEKHGWCQGEVFGPDDAVCAIGAIMATATNLGILDRAAGLLARYLDIGIDRVARWNDDPSRTKDQVISALREAAISEDVQ